MSSLDAVGAIGVGFMIDMALELEHARAKHPGEEGVLTDAEWLAVLTEEVGECARAIQDEGDDALRKELAQVAAMACRWYVSIPLGRERPPWAKGFGSGAAKAEFPENFE